MTTVIIFFVVLSVLVLVHELGHFWTARRAGAKVEEFGIGFPPRLFSIKRGETAYSFNLIFFGGFVKIFGEDEAETKKPGSFGALSLNKRAVVIAAGVVMNFLFAVLLISLVSGIGRPTIVDKANEATAKDVGIQVLQITSSSPADMAGFKMGDKIERLVYGEEVAVIKNTEDFQRFTEKHRGEEIEVAVDRQGTEMVLAITPRQEFPEGEGPVGIVIAKVGIVASPWWRALWDGFLATLELTVAIVVAVGQILGNLAAGKGLIAGIAGPVGIASLTGEAARLGLVYLLQFTALLSINLAILNILPFPALDGGRLVFLGIEKIKGSPVKKEIERAINFAGFALLMLLMIWVTWQDIVRFIL